MAFQRTPSFLYRKRPGSPWYLKLPIPKDLQRHYPKEAGSGFRTHIVEPLGTVSESEAEQLKREPLARHWAAFERLRKGLPMDEPRPPVDVYQRLAAIREDLGAYERPDDDVGREALLDSAEDLARSKEAELGEDAAGHLYLMATSPHRLTIREALAEWNAGGDVRESTKAKRAHVVGELLAFLKVEDCLPDLITDDRAVAYVDWLNGQPLGKSTKEDRLSSLRALWAFLARKRMVKRGANPWMDQEVTATRGRAGKPKRGWKDAEIIKLFEAPDRTSGRPVHYTRTLFRELYALGFTTGMRLDEIVSLRPQDLEVIPEEPGEGPAGFWITVEDGKTDASNRTIPIVHPVGVAVLAARLKRQPDPAASLFTECRPGGPDNKLSWHVGKALGRDRDGLGFGPELNFHGTRRSFVSLMDNSGEPVVHVQRYVGHKVGTLMHSVYSDGASRDSLMRVAKAVRYSEGVEAVLALAAR